MRFYQFHFLLFLVTIPFALQLQNEIINLNNDDKDLFSMIFQQRKQASSTVHKGEQNLIRSYVHSFVNKRVNFKGTSKKIRAVSVPRNRIWDYGVVPYEIDSNYNGWHKALFKHAMRHWENFTCIKFVERDEIIHSNYIRFKENPCGCCSFVGKKGTGSQTISIGRNCDNFGTVVHELGHVLGFWHEHTRPDRDNHVNILTENIITGQEFNFNKLKVDEIDSLSSTYDFGSIMHYGKNTFSKGIYFDTIRPIGNNNIKKIEIGQRIGLSEGDIAQANRLYQCPKCGRTFQEPSGNFTASPEFGECEWRITATYGERIILNISEMSIYSSANCSIDFLEIRDGYWRFSPVLGRFCGSNDLLTLKSTGNRLLITYLAKQRTDFNGFHANYEVVCGGDFSVTENGHLESPNYPDDYPSNKECIWKMSTLKGYQVALKFHAFEMENNEGCLYDYVEIRDGLSLQSPLLGVFCGNKIPDYITSNGSELLVRFVSDNSLQKSGFSATIMQEYNECNRLEHGCEHECINTLGSYYCKCQIGYELQSDGRTCKNACGGVIKTETGTITSPSFPDLYPNNKSCVWEIITLPGYRISLNFTHFDIEGNNLYQGQFCEYDKVDVISRISNNQQKLHGSFCGSQSPPLIISESHILRIEFKSDDNLQKTGFVAKYLTYKDECALNNGGCQYKCVVTHKSHKCQCPEGYTVNEGNCTRDSCTFEITSPFSRFGSPNYPNSYPSPKQCFWKFHTVPGYRIHIVFFSFDVECYYDYIVLYDGPTTNDPTLLKFCGLDIPSSVTSSTNQLLMSFYADSTVGHRKGFWAKHVVICGGILQAQTDKQIIFSHPKFGQSKYRSNSDCRWRIRGLAGYNLRLKFFSFALEGVEDECEEDYVEIFSENYVESSYGRYCGNAIPAEIYSVEEELIVHFHTGYTLGNDGFRLEYEATDIKLIDD